MGKSCTLPCAHANELGQGGLCFSRNGYFLGKIDIGLHGKYKFSDFLSNVGSTNLFFFESVGTEATSKNEHLPNNTIETFVTTLITPETFLTTCQKSSIL